MPTVACHDAAQLEYCCAINPTCVEKLSASIASTKRVVYSNAVLDYTARHKVNGRNCKVSQTAMICFVVALPHCEKPCNTLR